ncbi:hypothetical protein BU25DRAFT_460731 [Macroventuria anomochaeta]|uniref:Uncharacterized protein n=1 Tax=Macroventuria anomochaeta TaxID=301207 RepID=A0ACB6RT44_9PLEO|nr:uncharacterized protein BU25DRAFT_460731 [Macroventuria anomochaeta]KAF2624898.1 hypothetical protein BU25DRAFT_460731 [Macroventuria anomochaeta]
MSAFRTSFNRHDPETILTYPWTFLSGRSDEQKALIAQPNDYSKAKSVVRFHPAHRLVIIEQTGMFSFAVRTQRTETIQDKIPARTVKDLKIIAYPMAPVDLRRQLVAEVNDYRVRDVSFFSPPDHDQPALDIHDYIGSRLLVKELQRCGANLKALVFSVADIETGSVTEEALVEFVRSCRDLRALSLHYRPKDQTPANHMREVDYNDYVDYLNAQLNIPTRDMKLPTDTVQE